MSLSLSFFSIFHILSSSTSYFRFGLLNQFVCKLLRLVVAILVLIVNQNNTTTTTTTNTTTTTTTETTTTVRVSLCAGVCVCLPARLPLCLSLPAPFGVYSLCTNYMTHQHTHTHTHNYLPTPTLTHMKLNNPVVLQCLCCVEQLWVKAFAPVAALCP